MNRPRFVIRQQQQLGLDGKREWYWLLQGANGETVCYSEGFEHPTDARAAAKNARRLARLAKVER